MTDMHLVYVPATNHVLGVHHQVGSRPPTVASIVGDRGMRIGGIRGQHAVSTLSGNFATATTEQEQFTIAAQELAVRTLPAVQDVFTRPYQYVIDTSQVALLPFPSRRFRIRIDPTGSRVLPQLRGAQSPRQPERPAGSTSGAPAA